MFRLLDVIFMQNTKERLFITQP